MRLVAGKPDSSAVPIARDFGVDGSFAEDLSALLKGGAVCDREQVRCLAIQEPVENRFVFYRDSLARRKALSALSKEPWFKELRSHERHEVALEGLLSVLAKFKANAQSLFCLHCELQGNCFCGAYLASTGLLDPAQEVNPQCPCLNARKAMAMDAGQVLQEMLGVLSSLGDEAVQDTLVRGGEKPPFVQIDDDAGKTGGKRITYRGSQLFPDMAKWLRLSAENLLPLMAVARRVADAAKGDGDEESAEKAVAGSDAVRSVGVDSLGDAHKAADTGQDFDMQDLSILLGSAQGRDLARLPPVRKALCILIDASSSMSAAIGVAGKHYCTRAQVAALVALGAASKMEDAGGIVFLLHFADCVRSAAMKADSPQSYKNVRRRIACCDANGGGTDIKRSLFEAVAALKKEAEASASLEKPFLLRPSILLISDMKDNESLSALRTHLSALRAEGIAVHGISVVAHQDLEGIFGKEHFTLADGGSFFGLSAALKGL